MAKVIQKSRCGSSQRTVECYKTLDEKDSSVCDKTCGRKKSCRWKNQKSREDLRIHIANIYHTVVEKNCPGTLNRKPVFHLHFLKFIEETQRHITSPSDNLQELQPLRYALASVVRQLAPEFIDSKSERFDNRTRKKHFDLFLTWSDETGSLWGQESNSDYRREVERYKSGQHNWSRDSIEEAAEQAEAIQWASMNAIASLLYALALMITQEK